MDGFPAKGQTEKRASQLDSGDIAAGPIPHAAHPGDRSQAKVRHGMAQVRASETAYGHAQWRQHGQAVGGEEAGSNRGHWTCFSQELKPDSGLAYPSCQHGDVLPRS